MSAPHRLTIPKLDVDVPMLTQKALTLGEASALEKACGMRFQEITEDTTNTAVVAAMIWLSARRQHLAITIADIQALTFDDFDLTPPEDDQVDPSQPAAQDSAAAGEETAASSTASDSGPSA